MKFDILNRWTGAVQFTAEIDCDEGASRSIKIGLSVKWALKNGARLDGARLDGARLDGASLVRASLDGASLDGASLVRARLDGASLDGARLVGASLDGASLVGASLDGASLDGARLVGASLDGASLVGASLDGARLDGASLVGARLVGARLIGASLDGASLVGASLDGATGNMREIKSAQIDTWPVTWTATEIQIGCQRHAIDLWRKADPRWIAAMDPKATEWWAKHGALVLGMVDASPAVATKLVEAAE